MLPPWSNLFASERRKFMVKHKIHIEIAYATPNKQKIISLQVNRGCTIQAAIEISGILTLFPDLDLQQQPVGIFGELRQLDDVVCDGERIEIYRPLIVDPKTARRKRATSHKVSRTNRS